MSGMTDLYCNVSHSTFPPTLHPQWWKCALWAVYAGVHDTISIGKGSETLWGKISSNQTWQGLTEVQSITRAFQTQIIVSAFKTWREILPHALWLELTRFTHHTRRCVLEGDKIVCVPARAACVAVVFLLRFVPWLNSLFVSQTLFPGCRHSL